MEVKKNPKVSINAWSNVFFLFGLAVMLFVSWRAIEHKSYGTKDTGQHTLNVQDNLEMDIPITELMKPPPPPPPPPAAALPQVIEVVEDTEEVEETVFASTEADQDQEIIEIENIEEVEEVEEVIYVPFAVIEDVPIYPGCEDLSSNEARKQCMADHVMAFVQKHFSTELAGELGLEGRQRIMVQFKIDQKGDVTNVRARAPHPSLQEEAIKVIESLPKMIPGKQRGKPVGVLYALPILFVVEMDN